MGFSPFFQWYLALIKEKSKKKKIWGKVSRTINSPSLQLCLLHKVFEYFNFDPDQLFWMLGYTKSCSSAQKIDPFKLAHINRLAIQKLERPLAFPIDKIHES
jgi:hypothetical protein